MIKKILSAIICLLFIIGNGHAQIPEELARQLQGKKKLSEIMPIVENYYQLNPSENNEEEGKESKMLFWARCHVKHSPVCWTWIFRSSLSKAIATAKCWIQPPSQNNFENSCAGRRSSFILNSSVCWLAGLKPFLSRFRGWARFCFAMLHRETILRYLPGLRLKTASCRCSKD